MSEVPLAVWDGRVSVRIARAWPGGLRDDGDRIVFEGRDLDGALRAGYLDRGPHGDRVKVLASATDPKLPALGAVAGSGQLLVHRAGKRAVVRTPTVFVKVVRAGRAADVATRSRVAAELAAAAGMAAPEVLGATDDTVEFASLPGIALHDLSDSVDWTDAWAAWAQAWPALARTRDDRLPTHDADAEARVVTGWIERAIEHDMLAAEPWSRLASEVADRLRALPEVEPVTTHRDLHDKQLLWDGERLGVLDFDTAALADPALDLTNLAVHAQLRVAQGIWSAEAASVVGDAVGRVASALAVDPAHLAAYRAAVLVRLAAVYAFRPDWARPISSWALAELTAGNAGGGAFA